jgi:hypothetical protein
MNTFEIIIYDVTYNNLKERKAKNWKLFLSVNVKLYTQEQVKWCKHLPHTVVWRELKILKVLGLEHFTFSTFLLNYFSFCTYTFHSLIRNIHKYWHCTHAAFFRPKHVSRALECSITSVFHKTLHHQWKITTHHNQTFKTLPLLKFINLHAKQIGKNH